jgi:hypothetical protein
MGRNGRGNGGDARDRVETTLRRCLEWSRDGSHHKVVSEIARVIGEIDDDHLRAALLTWDAQAHLAMGDAERALPSATLSWELEPSPQACHLTSSALEALGNVDRSEQLLRMGWRLFPEAVHLPVQLAVNLSDQARVPEALDILEEVGDHERVPSDLQVFLFGMRANLLALMGRWAEAEEVLRVGRGAHPDSRLLEDAHDSVEHARRRSQAEKRLAASWRGALTEVHGVGVEVDDAVCRCIAVNELTEIVELAARRLWRALLERDRPRPHSPEAWAAGIVFCILELDGHRAPVAPFARSFACAPSSVRKVVRRVRAFLDDLEPEIRRRAFAARTNPRLEDSTARGDGSAADVIQFPGM